MTLKLVERNGWRKAGYGWSACEGSNFRRIVRDGKGGHRGRLTSQRLFLARSHKSHKCLVCVMFFFFFLFRLASCLFSRSPLGPPPFLLLDLGSCFVFKSSFSVKAISGGERQGGHHAHPKISLRNLCTFASSPHPSSPSWPPPLLNLRWLSVSIPPIHAESAQPLQAIAPWLGRLTVLPAFLPASVHRMQTVHSSWQLFIANVRALAHDPIFSRFFMGETPGKLFSDRSFSYAARGHFLLPFPSTIPLIPFL